jgi:TPR repeat protein
VWYQRAASQGNVKAMHNLAVLSAGRDQSAMDYAEAAKWFQAAAAHGLADSQYNLGVLYESGLGVPRDLKQSYLWLSLAARSGDKEAGKRRDAVRGSLSAPELALPSRSTGRTTTRWPPAKPGSTAARPRCSSPADQHRQTFAKIWKVCKGDPHRVPFIFWPPL